MSLEIRNITIRKNGREAIKDLSFSVDPGKAVAVLGANGAGKSELVLGLAGMLPITSGSITADGKDITNSTPDRIRAEGLAAVPEGHRVLTDLTVDENLRTAGGVLRNGAEETLNSVYERFPELATRKSQLAGTLSGGQQQMVALGHALMCRPKYLVIDEMSLGLAPVVVARLMSFVTELKAEGVGIVLIEQFTELALKACEGAIVLRLGTATYSGDAGELQADKTNLDKAYFGHDEISK